MTAASTFAAKKSAKSASVLRPIAIFKSEMIQSVDPTDPRGTQRVFNAIRKEGGRTINVPSGGQSGYVVHHISYPEMTIYSRYYWTKLRCGDIIGENAVGGLWRGQRFETASHSISFRSPAPV